MKVSRHNMNSQKITSKGKVMRPCPKRKAGKLSNNTSTHVPTLRCHEEVMSKLSSCYTNEDCLHGPLLSVDKSQVQNKITNKSRKNKEVGKRAVSIDGKIKYVHPMISLPISIREEDQCIKTFKSKSIPLNQKHTLEDSVDFIPVKLSSTNEIHRRQKDDLPKQVKSAPCRPTWDKLLKGEAPLVYRPTCKTKGEVANLDKKCETNFQSEGSLPGTPTKKVSINTQTKKYDKDYEATFNSNNLLGCPKTNVLTYNPFCISDPLKALDFLIKQLREKLLKKPENENLQKIILDMENALLKISFENHVDPKKTNQIALSNVNSATDIVSKLDINSDGFDTKSKNGHLNIAQLQKGLEESCLFLQSLCIKQKETCDNHIREKEQLTIQLAESRRLLAIAKSKEKDYEVTIGELRLKMQEVNSQKDHQHSSVKDLTDIVTKLKSENEMLKSSRAMVKKLNLQLKEIALEKDSINSKLHLKELEVEKLKVLLEAKGKLSPALDYDKKDEGKETVMENNKILDITIENHDKSIVSLSTLTSLQDERQLICSSQASSSPRYSPSPCNSWQHISSIYERPTAASDLKKCIAGIFHDLQKKTEPHQLSLEAPSSDNSFWSNRDELDVNLDVVFSDVGSGTMSS